LDFSCDIPTGEKDEDGDDVTEHVHLLITPNDLKKIDPEAGTFTYVLKEGTPEMAVLVFTRESYKNMYNWQDAI
jgi:hypothetical protein